MSTSAEYDFAGHDDRIRLHYDHAREALPPCTCGGEAATVERGTEPEGFAIMCSRCFRKTALHPTLSLAEEEWRTMLTTNNKTTKENNNEP